LTGHVVRIYLNEGENFTLNYTSAPSYVSNDVPVIQVDKERITVGEAMYVHQLTINGPINGRQRGMSPYWAREINRSAIVRYPIAYVISW